MANGARHTLHSYFNSCPESPDGRRVVYFAAHDAEGHVGDVCVIDRGTGDCRVLAGDVVAEDAHRQAYQQWIGGGRWVIYQDGRDGEWTIKAVAIDTGQTRELARGRQLGFASPSHVVAPIHGLHWNPGPHRDIELLNVETGHISTAVTAARLLEEAPDWIDQHVGGRDISLFFGVFNGDASRMIFKVSRPEDGIFCSPRASRRVGMIGFDLRAGVIDFVGLTWGHPAWHPDGRHIVTLPNVLIDATDGRERPFDQMPVFAGAHPSFHPDGRWIVTDAVDREAPGGCRWSVIVVDPATGEQHTVHACTEPEGGATSWRSAHPHPVFNRDGSRLYFNVNVGRWSQLYVADITDVA